MEDGGWGRGLVGAVVCACGDCDDQSKGGYDDEPLAAIAYGGDAADPARERAEVPLVAIVEPICDRHVGAECGLEPGGGNNLSALPAPGILHHLADPSQAA